MNTSRSRFLELVSTACLLAGSLFASSAFAAVTVNVVDNDGNTVDGFRWLLQEDATFAVDPANPSTNPDELLSLNFVRNYHAVKQNGNVDAGPASITVDPGRYFISVLPYSGYGIGGHPVEVVTGDETVNITVQKHPIPTAQISVYLFHDNFPINGAPDLPEEENPLPGEPGFVDWSQFSVVLEEPGGRYGIAGGQVIQDAFGNALGTTYVRGCDADGNADADPTTNYGCLDMDGAPIVLAAGDGTLSPDPDGTLLIQNLAPGKYGILVIPPTDSGWQQVSTIEGTKVIDAWVKPNEPPFFVEFGPPGPHVFIGFSQQFNALPGGGGATVSGVVTDMHMSRPPDFTFYSGRPFPGCWIGVNESTAGGLGRALYVEPCDDESGFSIPNVPPGSYQLTIFDKNLDVVIASQGFTVDANGIDCDGGTVAGCSYGEVAVFNWFARLNTGIFNDKNQNGFWDANGADGVPDTADDENGIGPESQDVTLRWPDGTIYANFPTDTEGFAPFDEVFPFFHWLVAEVSFANKKATGATYVVDAGGPIPGKDGAPTLPGYGGIDGFPDFGELAPQPQSENGGLPYRTETGPVLTTGFQAFLGQTNVMHFGKTDYRNLDLDLTSFPPAITYIGENGGISGIVYYATTRAENDPELAAAEEWEPGVPRVQVNLYADGDIDSFPLGDFPNLGLDGIAGTPDDTFGDVDWNENGVRDLDDDAIDDLNGDGLVTLADVDNYPFDWYCQGELGCPGIMGPEDVENSGSDGVFDLGDAVQVAYTDSWDDNQPTGCQGANNLNGPALGLSGPIADDRCFDGQRNFNQIRPGVFDGGYAFADYDLGHLGALRTGVAEAAISDFYAHINGDGTTPGVINDPNLQLGLIPGDYIVEAVTPPGYKLMKEEDKNVDWGDDYVPSTQAFPAACVGDMRPVPPFMSMTTKDGSGGSWMSPGVADTTQLITGIAPADAEAPFAGDIRPLCDRKKVPLSGAQNAGAEFWVMTDVPVAGNVTGVILNDLGNEFNPNSPNLGEKFAPPNVPIGFYDWNGKEVSRIYGDSFGRYNLVVPSTYSANLPQPSGMSPNMLIACMNDAGTGPDPDPFWNPAFSQFCYTFQYMPGATTYLDTPVVPIAAFASPVTYPVDCEMPTSTPVIASVTRDAMDGPYALPGQTILIDSMGPTMVDNPDWDNTSATTRKIERDYSFAAGCTASLQDSDGATLAGALTVNSCTAAQVSATIAGDTPPGAYQVVVTNPGGTESPIGVTLTVGDPAGDDYAVIRVPEDFTTIQDAIDAALDGDLILVGPAGSPYNELVIMYKAVKLQGWGAGVVTINARQAPTDKTAEWRATTDQLVAAGEITPLLGQEAGVGGFPALAAVTFPFAEGAGVFVAGKITGSTGGPNPQTLTNFRQNPGARVDGFSIIGASTGGGVAVNGYAADLSIGNDRINGNSGALGGGIRVGQPQSFHEDPDTNALIYDDAENDRVRIHHNFIAKNGGQTGAGGGVSLNTGADQYQVTDNRICGNFTSGSGGGIGHLGRSDIGLIADNEILFNESFAQAEAQAGGGIFIGGQAALQANADGLLLSPGAGSVTVDSNVIRGNMAGAGDGGGMVLAAVNGADVADSPNQRSRWNTIRVINNMITNNVAALAGGGIVMQDAARVFIDSNTVAHNETTATSALAFAPGTFNQSNPTPAGIVARTHSADFATLIAGANVPNNNPGLEFFSSANISNSIIEHNRSFFWLNFNDPATPAIETGLFPATCPVTGGAPGTGAACDVEAAGYDPAAHTADLAVMNGPFTVANPADVGMLEPSDSLLTDTNPDTCEPAAACDNSVYIGVDGNITGDPAYVNGYFNGARNNLNIQEFTTLQTAGAFDEGGNFIQVAFGPLSMIDSATTLPLDFHIAAGSAAINAGDTALAVDIDDDPRPNSNANPADIGADEAQ